MKIFFYFSIYDLFFCEIAGRLARRIPHLKFGGIVFGLVGFKRLKERNFTEDVSVFTPFLRKNGISKQADQDFLKIKEEELGIPNLSMLIASDRAVSKFPREKALRILELEVRFVEEILERAAPDLILMDDVCCMLSYLIYKIGKKRGVPVWSVGTVRLNDRVCFYDDCLDQRQDIKEIYQRLQKISLSEEQRNQAEDYRHQYVENFMPTDYLKFKTKRPGLSLESARMLFRGAVNYFQDPMDFTRLSIIQMIRQRLMRILRFHSARLLGLFDRPIPEEKFIYYPIQAQPERSTLILAPFYLDQIVLIENISKSLPIDHYLYVKDHPISGGRRPLSEFKRIRRLLNVRLIQPEFPSQELVKNCQAVITVSNTVGMEAILFEKPLIVLGDAFYTIYKLATYVDNIKDLPLKIPEVLRNFNPDREELYRFLIAVLEGSYPGTRRHPVIVPYVMSEENLEKVAKGLLKQIEKHFANCTPRTS